MATPRRSRSALVATVLAPVGLAGLAVYPAVESGAYGPLVAIPGLVAVLSLAAALALRVPAAVPWALAPFLVEYGVFLVRAKDDAYAPVVAAALVAVAEVAYWALEPRPVGDASRTVVRRVVTLVLLTAVSAAVAAFVLGASRLDTGGGIALEALGAAAIVGAIAVLAVLARGTPTG